MQVRLVLDLGTFGHLSDLNPIDKKQGLVTLERRKMVIGVLIGSCAQKVSHIAAFFGILSKSIPHRSLFWDTPFKVLLKLCYAMLRYVMLRCAMLCYVMLC